MSHNVRENETDFQLKWEIANPFSSWEKLKETFEAKKWFCSNLYRWNVKLRPLNRSFDSLSFLCSLSCEIDYQNENEEPTTECVEIVITLNGAPINRNLVFDYPFNEETIYTHSFEVEIKVPNEPIEVLGILVYIDIKREEIGGAHALRNGSEIDILHGGRPTDLNSIAIALEESLLSRSYCTMSMFSSENTEFFVHHCILDARWRNLFTEHNLDENSSSVKTNISYSVLSSIIHYLYSTKVNICPIIRDLAFTAEFFQVIWRYKVFHLYETLTQRDVRVSKYTMNYIEKRKISFPLNCVMGSRLKQHSFMFPVYLYPKAANPESSFHSFLFVIYLRYENSCGPWLSYSVMSRTSIPFVVHVTLQIPGKMGFVRVDSSEYNFFGNGSAKSEPILFLGSLETLRPTQNHKDHEIPAKLIFELIFTPETSNVGIWHLSNPENVEIKRLEILSLHMRDVLLRQFKTDLEIQPLSNGGVVPSFRVHKAIFNARLPGWRNVVEPHLPEDAVLPNIVMVPLSNQICQRVVSYIYSGTMFYACSSQREEIFNFAHDSNFELLQTLVNLMHISYS